MMDDHPSPPSPQATLKEQPQDSPQPLPASHLDPWLTVKPGSPLAALVAQTMDYLPNARRDALAKREAIVGALFANLTLSPAVAVPLANAKLTRYDRREVVSSQLKPTLDVLEMCFLIIKHPAEFKKRRTIIEAHPRLEALFASNGVSLSDVARLPDEEVIFLRKRKTPAKGQDADAGEQAAPFDASTPDAGDLIDYTDTRETRRMRDEVRAFNQFLAAADIRLEGHTGPTPFKPFRRIFSTDGKKRFDLHGRLYGGQAGGWHQGLAKDQRHRIRINGEPVADLDFANMHVRLAYAEAGCEPPEGDPYCIPGLEDHRDGVKAVTSAMLSRIGELTKLPSTVRAMLPQRWKGPQVAAAIKAHHPRIAYLFGQDRGIRYMFTDSTILMAVLMRLTRKGIPALPMHDGLMVPQSARDLARRIMEEEAHRIAGVDLPVFLVLQWQSSKLRA